MTHEEMITLLRRRLSKGADITMVECRLPNQKIADIRVQRRSGTTIFEVKTILKESLIVSAYEKYHAYCHYLIMACPPQNLPMSYSAASLVWEKSIMAKVGILFVTWTDLHLVKEPIRLK